MHKRLGRSYGWMTVLMFSGMLAATGCKEASRMPPVASTNSTAVPPESGFSPLPNQTEPEVATSDETAPDAAAPVESQPQKAKREPIYDTETSGEELIAVALRRAQRDHKHVLVEWGGNWCGWCYKLHDVFANNKDVQPIVYEEYELVLIDSNSNQDLMREYGGQDRQFSYPHLTVLDATGQVLTNQNTEPLEEGPAHNPQVVAEFLRKWTPEKIDAEQAVAAALKQASDEDRRVLVRVGTPYCGWCKVLAQFVQDHGELFAKDYIDLKIDTHRMAHGKEIADRFLPEKALGVPWMVILDSSGKTLASSVGPQGNIGYPYQPEEVDHFLSMLRETRRNLTDAELETIAGDLTAYREQREQKLAEKKTAQN